MHEVTSGYCDRLNIYDMGIASNSLPLPEDSASLRTQVEQLQVELLRAQLELERYKKLYYGPRADR
ncbi:MAG: hypothetical protein WAN35_04385 [Terracidiphilus sp.]